MTSTRAGFALIEVLVAALVLSAVFGAIYAIQSAFIGLQTTVETTGALEEKASQALNEITRDLRWAERGSLLITQENGADRLDLRRPTAWVGGSPVWSSVITFRVEPSNIDANGNGVADDFRLARMQDGRTRVLCNYVVAGGFSIQQTGQNVDLLVQLAQFNQNSEKTITANAQSSISPRN